MRFLNFCLPALFFLLNVPAYSAAPSAPAPTRVTLTRINASAADGLLLHLTRTSLTLFDLTGDQAASFPVTPSSLKINPTLKVTFKTSNKQRKYLTAREAWKLTDGTGEGVEVLDNTLRTLVVINQVDHALTLSSHSFHTNIPGHSFLIVNNPPADTKLDYGSSGWLGYSGDYCEKMWPILSPTVVTVSPNQSGITGGFPQIVESTHASGSTDLGNG